MENDLESRLAILRKNYLAKLDDKLAVVREAVDGARAGDADAFATALREAHKLHGTAGSYGLLGVSNLLGRVETLLKEVEQGGGPVDAYEQALALIDDAGAQER